MPSFHWPRCSVILFITLHNANRKCALFGRALTKSKLKVLIVARPAMLAVATDKAQMSACPMVRLTSDTDRQKQHKPRPGSSSPLNSMTPHASHTQHIGQDCPSTSHPSPSYICGGTNTFHITLIISTSNALSKQPTPPPP